MKLFHFVALIAALFIGCAMPAYSEIDYGTIINLSGKQRMLTQKMSKEALQVGLGLDKEQSIQRLKESRDLFDRTLKGLRHGDAELGLAATTQPHILKALSKVDKLWEDYDFAVSAIAQVGEVYKPQVKIIAAQNMPILRAMDRVVSLYEGSASLADMEPSLATAINLAGRQRMLSQKMTKEFLLIAIGHNADLNKRSLKETISLFDFTLDGLIAGDETQGLSPAPTPAIRAQLIKVKAIWADFRLKLVEEPSEKSIRYVVDKNLLLLNEMNRAVEMYAHHGHAH